MRVVSCYQRSLQIQTGGVVRPVHSTGLGAWDALLPEGGFTRQGVHELLFDEAIARAAPSFPALLLARGMMGWAASPGEEALDAFTSRKLVWCDADSTLYPPAVALAGVPLDQLCVIRPTPTDVTWAVAECLRCTGVGVVVATLPSGLSRVEVRRLQLAAERGGGTGVMLRPLNHARNGDVYAAATRWLISPAPGDRLVQRWTVQLIYGHGGHQGQSIVLEARRGYASALDVSARLPDVPAHPVHPPAALAGRTASAPVPRASA